jgi:DNA-cytosine methyltransferase
MKYGSLFSGIEAATVAWEPLGWTPAWFAEVDKFPCAVLAHHYPDTPNLGDVTNVNWKSVEPVDLIVGGSPCQSFSVAGKRLGLDDDRGNLAIKYLSIVDTLRPTWFVFENVPGLLSSGGGRDLEIFLNEIEKIGYIFDLDILDAQFHGLAQRRRRLFICGRSVESLLKKKTTFSALIICQCLQEILHGTLIEMWRKLENAHPKYESASLSSVGVKKRIKLFGIVGEKNNWQMLLNHLIDAFQKSKREQKKSGAFRGEKEADTIQGGPLMGLKTVDRFTLTEELLKKDLEDLYQVMKSFTTSTETNKTTIQKIYMCSKAALTIGKLILLLNQSSPSFWTAASSTLMCLEEYTGYARQTSSNFFGDLERVQFWFDFIREAERTVNTIRDIRVRNFGSIFSLGESVSGNHPPSRESGAGVAEGIAPCLRGRSNSSHKEDSETYIPEISPAMKARDYKGPSSDGDGDGDGLPLVAHTLRAEHDASEDGTGRGTPLVPVAFQAAASSSQSMDVRTIAPPLDVGKAGAVSVYGFLPGQGSGAGGIGFEKETAPTLRSGCDKYGLLNKTGVRRLLPIETERLQGFPDGYTNIAYGRPQHPDQICPDGPRYKALGNSMAVPVMRWIGARIQLVEDQCRTDG